ncbi:DinB family protein [Cytophagaceae bacterium DM2B3-1]|uniref:DinB family protein n=1 Tax=Xanthocytophaga flava TaxID=3048013 RepID=A0ABT7CF64_9BACT|nr:DinB family protein [Xanthocytophaga flavus]MDJ1468978.1 DinB family protein [Xanthocytophaga flavus]MDJ1492156.1 DinB family protein [Xanthocytophaga flavus]
MIPASEKDTLYKALTEAFDAFISTIYQIDESVVNTIPFTGSWTPAQVVTHILLATDGLPDNKTMSTNRAYDSCLPQIRPWWEDLSQKFQSPESLMPDSLPHQKSELITKLKHVKEKDLAIISEKDLTAICHDFELPGVGYLTRYEWLWFIQMHLKRHQFQLENMVNRSFEAGR